jgi:hypothetical protein
MASDNSATIIGRHRLDDPELTYRVRKALLWDRALRLAGFSVPGGTISTIQGSGPIHSPQLNADNVTKPSPPFSGPESLVPILGGLYHHYVRV